jgi:hypothetical protein
MGGAVRSPNGDNGVTGKGVSLFFAEAEVSPNRVISNRPIRALPRKDTSRSTVQKIECLVRTIASMLLCSGYMLTS